MGNTETAAAIAPSVELVRVDRINPSPLNRHCGDDDQDIVDLASSIMEAGLLSPISIRPVDGERFEIICGERRWRAFRWLGKEDIPCIVKSVDEAQAHAERLIENAQRKDLTILEQGAGVAELLKRCNNNIKDVADRLGYSERWVGVRAKLPNLSDAWRAELADPETSYGDIRDSIGKLAIVASLPQNTQDDILANGYLRHHSSSVSEMHKTLERLFMNLDTKPWTRAWEKENVSSRKRCDACLKRSDRELTLFSELDNDESDKDAKKLCLDGDCWKSRLVEWCKGLFINTPDAVALWDGHVLPVHEKHCQEHYEKKLLNNHAWTEREPEEKPYADFTIASTGIFVGGARAGACVDIWLRSETDDKEFDAEQKAKAEARQRDFEARRAVQENVEAQLKGIIPDNAFELKAKSGISDFEFAATLLNWTAWFGVGSARYDNPAIDVTDISAESCPGIQHAWSELREEITELVVQAVNGDELKENDWFVVTTVCEMLSFTVEDLGRICKERVDNAQV